MADPVGCLVAQANASNVRHVLVDGRFVKRDGELVGVDVPRARSLAEAASERVLGGLAAADQPVLGKAPPDFADALNAMAAQNLARAWTTPVAG